MSKTIAGIYRNGRIELLEIPSASQAEGRVLITFLESAEVVPGEREIGEERAAAIRTRLSSFASEWDSPEMAIYDDYDRAKASL